MGEKVEVECIVTQTCWYDGKLREPGSKCWYAGDEDDLPQHLLPAEEMPGVPVNHPDEPPPQPKVSEDHLPPSKRTGATERVQLDERQEELQAACEMLDKSDPKLWFKMSRGPKLAAVNAILIKGGSKPADQAELQSLGYRKPK